MNTLPLHFKDLFAQLGLPHDDDSIRHFIKTNSPLDPSTPLAHAVFWTNSQASFLKEQILADADWAELVDQLNSALRA